jgi:hypothetical protein
MEVNPEVNSNLTLIRKKLQFEFEVIFLQNN